MFIKSEEMQVKPRVRLRDGYGTTDFLHIVPQDKLPEKSRAVLGDVT